MRPALKTSVVFLLLFLSTGLTARECNIKDYGALGDGMTKETSAIQQAIDAAHAEGGGTVLFPAGKYLSGTLYLKSFVTLRLNQGATTFSLCFPPGHLYSTAEEVRNLGIQSATFPFVP